MKTGIMVFSVSRNAGGLFESVKGLTLNLAKKPDISVDVWSLEDSYTATDLPNWNGSPVHIYRTWGPRHLGYAPGLLRDLHEAAPDLMHVNGLWMFTSMANLWLSYERRIPFIVSAHGMLDPWAMRNSYWRKMIASVLYERWHLRRAACMRALCEEEARSFRNYGLRNPICVIPNGVDLPQDIARSEVGRARLNVPPQKRVLLYVGRLHQKKGLLNLLTAWKHATTDSTSAREDDWHLVIAGADNGDGHADQLERAVRELAVEHSVSLVGPQYGAHKEECFRMAEAFVLPSFSEGVPMAVLEAWSYCIPAVITRACNLPEGASAGASLLVEPEPRSIAAGLQELFLLSDSERAAMGRQGRAIVERRFSWEKITEEMATVYQWLVGAGQKPDCVEL